MWILSLGQMGIKILIFSPKALNRETLKLDCNFVNVFRETILNQRLTLVSTGKS